MKTIDDFKDYIENLSRMHILVKHSEKEIHFAYLNDEKDNLLPVNMKYPFVLLGHEGYQISADKEYRNYDVTLSVLSHAEDTGNDAEINTLLSQNGTILEDFMKKMIQDGMNPETKWIRGVDFSGAAVSPVENKDNALYGQVATFKIALYWCKVLDDKTFDSSVFGSPEFTNSFA
jgi:hypothetical protein